MGAKRSQVKRWLLVVLVVFMAVALVGAGWLLASYTQSPAQRAAAAAPPTSAPVTVEVEQGDLTDQITATGVITGAQDSAVNLPATSADSVVTAVNVKAGEQLENTQVVAWINDRPLIAYQGNFPAYRDLYEGDSGADVSQLQHALVASGYQLAITGTLDANTIAALKHLYGQTKDELATTDTHQNESDNSSANQGGRNSNEAGASEKPQQAKKKVVIAKTEMLFVAQLPAVVTSLPKVGDSLNGDKPSQLGLSTGEFSVTAEVPAGVGSVLKTGSVASAVYGSQQLNLTLKTAAPKKDEKSQAEATTYTLTFSVKKGKLPSDARGKSMVLTVDRQAPIKNALLIPQRAMALDANGNANVLKRQASGFVMVKVEQLGCVSGQCAIKSDQLKVGDSVRVDRK